MTAAEADALLHALCAGLFGEPPRLPLAWAVAATASGAADPVAAAWAAAQDDVAMRDVLDALRPDLAPRRRTMRYADELFCAACAARLNSGLLPHGPCAACCGVLRARHAPTLAEVLAWLARGGPAP